MKKTIIALGAVLLSGCANISTAGTNLSTGFISDITIKSAENINLFASGSVEVCAFESFLGYKQTISVIKAPEQGSRVSWWSTDPYTVSSGSYDLYSAEEVSSFAKKLEEIDALLNSGGIDSLDIAQLYQSGDFKIHKNEFGVNVTKNNHYSISGDFLPQVQECISSASADIDW